MKKTLKAVEWGITRRCNYDCSYCVTKKDRLNKGKEKPLTVVKKILEYTDKGCHFIIGGLGEPFLADNFFKVVKKIISDGHFISIVTNFSRPTDEIIEFCNICGANLKHINASMHLERVDVDIFLEKTLKINNYLSQPLTISTVAVKAKIDELIVNGEKIKRAGLNFCLQPDKRIARDKKRTKYSKIDKQLVINNNQNFNKKIDRNYFGKSCFAGSKYIIVNPDGDAWTCFPATLEDNRNSFLGNFTDNSIKLYKDAMKCKYSDCFCSTPKHSGIVQYKKVK